jgi:hypothetical protein
VGAAAGFGLDQGAGDGLDLDSAAPGQVEQVAEGCPADPGGEQDAVDGAAGSEGLEDRAAALDQHPARAGTDRLPRRLQLAAAAGLLGCAGARTGPALLGRGLGPPNLSPAVLFAAVAGAGRLGAVPAAFAAAAGATPAGAGVGAAAV